MKKLFTIVAIALAIPAAAQQNPQEKRILEQANKMGELLLKKDYKNFLVYVNPTITEMIGGADAMVKTLETSTAQMEGQGYVFKKVSFGKPGKLVDTANTLQCIVPETLYMSTPQGDFANYTSLLALSKDKGKTWVFTEVTPEKLERLKKIIPAISSTLSVPESKAEKAE